MIHVVELTQDAYNAVMNAVSSEIRKCFECSKEDAQMMEDYKKNLLLARELLKSGLWATRLDEYK